MNYIEASIVLLVAIIHIYIMYLEMALWTTKKGIKAFGLKNKQFAEDTKILAANQGLYNGFLAAGLIWAFISDTSNIAIFFLACVTFAGLYGAYSTKKIRILYIQTIPATLGIISLLLL
jgi:putative membrane protein